jgi:hypothetical protein
MNLKQVSNADLLKNAQQHARDEKESGIKLLHHLKEIEARRLFAVQGYSTLYNYCLGELGLSEGTAGRRIQAMRLIRDLPEYLPKLEEGGVHESNLSKIQSFFNQEEKKDKPLTKEAKLELLETLEGKSFRQTEQHLAGLAPETAKKDKKRAINASETEIRFTADKELMSKLEKLQNLLGHQLGDQKYRTLLHKLADIALKKLEPRVSPTLEKNQKISETRYIPEKVKALVWKRDGGKCTYISPDGKRCNSEHALQYEVHRPTTPY